MMAISGGRLTIAGGKASPAWGDPGIWYGAISRVAGRALLLDLNIADVTNSCEFGWDTAAAGAISAHALRFASDAVNVYAGGAAGPVIATPVDATEYQLAAVLRSTGVYWYIKGERLPTGRCCGAALPIARPRSTLASATTTPC